MKIVILQDVLRSGGTERQTVFLAKWLHARGENATVVTFRPGGKLAPDLAAASVPHVSLQSRDWHADWLAPRLIAKLRALQPDVILCMGRQANMRARRLRRRFPHCVVIGSMRTGKSLPWFYRRALRSTHAVIANSRKARNRLIDEVGLAPSRVHVIHNAIVYRPPPAEDSAADRSAARGALGVPAEAVVMLCVAMFRPEKNQAGLISACYRLANGLNWRLWMVGDGPAEKECRALTARLGLEDRIRFFGFQEDPAPFYQAADIAVLSSRSESLPNFLVEAQWHGLPVVAEDVSGVGESFLPGASGLLIPPGDTAAFIHALERLIASPEQRSEMSAAAHDYARGAFDHNRQAEKTLTLFRSLREANR